MLELILFEGFVSLFTVLHPTQEYFTYMETSSLPVKGCKILAYARRH
jgi:hypothetical protein